MLYIDSLMQIVYEYKHTMHIRIISFSHSRVVLHDCCNCYFRIASLLLAMSGIVEYVHPPKAIVSPMSRPSSAPQRLWGPVGRPASAAMALRQRELGIPETQHGILQEFRLYDYLQEK